MKHRNIGKMNRPNDGNRSFYESILNRHVLTSLKYLSHNNIEYVIIGDFAVSYHVKPFASKKLEILVLDKNINFKYYNNICKNIDFIVNDISDLNISEEEYRYIVKTSKISDGFKIASPTVLVSFCARDLGNIHNGAEAYTICTNCPIIIYELFSNKTEYINFVYDISYDYRMIYLKNLDDYFKCRIFEGTSGCPEVDEGFKDWIRESNNNDQVLIGGIALINCYIERTVEYTDLLFLSNTNLKELPKFNIVRENVFSHYRTKAEIESLNYTQIGISKEFADIIFETSYDKGKFKIASPSAIVALKLNRFSDSDEIDIKCLIDNYDIDISIFIPYLSEQEIENYNSCLLDPEDF
jgi:hypothetical protein